MWVGQILMGSSFKGLNVVWDTGSDWLVVQSMGCSNCKGNMYDTTKPTVVENTKTERNYGSASLKGFVYSDKVCMSGASCVNSFKYFGVTE